MDIEVPQEFVKLAKDWHNGQTAPLYEVASTGKIRVQRLWFLDGEIRENMDLEVWEDFPEDYQVMKDFRFWIVNREELDYEDIDWEE